MTYFQVRALWCIIYQSPWLQSKNPMITQWNPMMYHLWIASTWILPFTAMSHQHHKLILYLPVISYPSFTTKIPMKSLLPGCLGSLAKEDGRCRGGFWEMTVEKKLGKTPYAYCEKWTVYGTVPGNMENVVVRTLVLPQFPTNKGWFTWWSAKMVMLYAKVMSKNRDLRWT